MLSNPVGNLRANYVHPKLSWNFLRVYGVYGVYPFGTTLRWSRREKMYARHDEKNKVRTRNENHKV